MDILNPHVLVYIFFHNEKYGQFKKCIRRLRFSLVINLGNCFVISVNDENNRADDKSLDSWFRMVDEIVMCF
jgi:hypothetical protein